MPVTDAYKGRSGGMADATDSKSVVLRDMRVQVPPPVPNNAGLELSCPMRDSGDMTSVVSP